MSADQITALVRQLLPILGTMLALFGFSASTASSITNLLMQIAGPIVVVGSAIWAAVANRPASIAASAQKIDGVEVNTSGAAPAVSAAVNAVKAAG